VDGVAPEEAGDDGEGEEREAGLDRARAQGVAALQARDEVVERPRRPRPELTLLDEVEQAAREGTKRAAYPKKARVVWMGRKRPFRTGSPTGATA
jgi:hypothetical protein